MSSLLAEIKAALRGTDTDYTEGPLRRAIILLAVPMVLEMVMESLFAVVNIFWIAKLGADSVASVGLTESVLSVIYALAMGLSIGVTAMVSRRIGEKNQEAAARVTVQAILLGLAVATVLGTSGFLFAPHLLGLMGATPEVIAAGTGYARIILGGDATVILLFLINAAFRGAGDATIAMRVLWTANAINLLLDPFLIFGWGPFPELGVTGAAVATTIARGSGVLIQLAVLVQRHRAAGRGAEARRRRLQADVVAHPLSAVGTFQMIVGMVSWIGLVRILSTFGSAALAGYTIAIRVVIFALLPSWGLSNAAATMVGQGLGAKKPDRAEQAVWTAANYNAVFLTVVGVIFFAGANLLVGLFTHDADVADVRGVVPPYREPRLPALRLRHGADAVVQRGRRHLDADLAQPLLLLALGNSAGVGARACTGVRATGRVHLHYRGLLYPRRGERRTLPSRPLEASRRLAARSCSVTPVLRR